MTAIRTCWIILEEHRTVDEVEFATGVLLHDQIYRVSHFHHMYFSN